MQEIYNLLLEIFKLIKNIHEIAIANNQFQQAFDERLTRIESAVLITPEPEPNAAGAEEETKEK